MDSHILALGDPGSGKSVHATTAIMHALEARQSVLAIYENPTVAARFERIIRFDAPSDARLKVVGAGTSICGFRADLIVADDPARLPLGTTPAEQERHAARLQPWWDESVRCRLSGPDARMLVVATDGGEPFYARLRADPEWTVAPIEPPAPIGLGEPFYMRGDAAPTP